jgi:UDP-2-acetamido-2-deoxy-ribo-hexuluronate aminotransferase
VHGQGRKYEYKNLGINARMDTIQAAILRVKLKYFDENIKLRRNVVEMYNEKLAFRDTHPTKHEFGTPPKRGSFPIVTPFVEDFNLSTYAQYSIRVKNRDELQKKLNENGIPTAIHYPIPLHLQEVFAYLGYKKGDFPIAEMISDEIISLPLNPYLTDLEIDFICRNILK